MQVKFNTKQEHTKAFDEAQMNLAKANAKHKLDVDLQACDDKINNLNRNIAAKYDEIKSKQKIPDSYFNFDRTNTISRQSSQ